MLNCKQVATLASDYLDKNTNQSLNWKIRMHLLMCSHCRRFVKHLKITTIVAQKNPPTMIEEDVDLLLQRIKEKIEKN